MFVNFLCMSPDTNPVVITEKMPSYMRRRIIYGLLLLGLALSGYFAYSMYLTQTTVGPTRVLFESFGLEEPIDSDFVLTGELYFTAQVADEPTSFLSIIQKSFDADTQGIHSPYMARSYAVSTLAEELFIANVEDPEDPDGWRVVWRNPNDGTEGYVNQTVGWNETDLTLSDTGVFAYSYQTEDNFESQNISDWNIAIHSLDGSVTLSIEDAVEPQLSRDGEWLYYMKFDGIYRYSFASSSHELISDVYTNYSVLDDFVVDSRGETLLVTSAFQHMISVQSMIENESAVEIGRIVTPETIYRHPVISGDDNHYAVQALTADRLLQIEIRQLNSSNPVSVLPVNEYVPESVALQGWGLGNISISNEIVE